jgi:hypothetical protein
MLYFYRKAQKQMPAVIAQYIPHSAGMRAPTWKIFHTASLWEDAW